MTRFHAAWAALACGLLLVAGCGKKGPQELTSTAGGFKIMMPGKPVESTEDAGELKITKYVFDRSHNSGVGVAFADIDVPAKETPAQTQKRLDALRDAMLAKLEGQLRVESPIKLAGKYPGREVEADLPKMMLNMRVRYYLVDRRMYEITVVGPATFVGSLEATKFLDSFALIQ